MAQSIIHDFKATKDGRGIFMKFRNVYECASNVQQMALMAMQKLNSLTMTYNANGGVPAFITKFRNNLNDLNNAGQTMPDVMAKSMFLQKIKDRDYAHIVDMLMDSNHSLEVCMQRVLDKFNMLDARKESKGRNANSAKKDDKKRNRNGKKGDKEKDKKREKGENRQSNNTNSKDKPKKGVTYEMIKNPTSRRKKNLPNYPRNKRTTFMTKFTNGLKRTRMLRRMISHPVLSG